MRKIVGDLETRAREELYININPIQAAGRLTPEAMRAVIAYGDGYSTCDACRKPFRLDKIQKPAIQAFHVELADFSRRAHQAARQGEDLTEIQREIDRSAGRLWGLGPSEVDAIGREVDGSG